MDQVVPVTTKKQIVLFDNDAASFLNFRGAFARDLRKEGYEVHLLLPINSEKEKKMLLNFGLPFTNIKLNRTSKSFFKFFLEYREIRSSLSKIQPDILFNYTAKPFLLGSFAGKSLGIKKIYTMLPGLGYLFSGGGGLKRLLKFIVCIAYKLSFRFNEKIFVLNSDDEKELLSKKLILKEKIIRLKGEGVDLDYFKTRKSKEYSHISFLFAGRLIKEKGVHDFIAAASLLYEKYKTVNFRIAGSLDKNPSSLSKKELETLSGHPGINYIGFIQNMKDELERTSVFVLPSFYREGLPRTIIEALAMNVPVITTHSVGCRESVIDNDNGYLVPPHSPKELANKMECFIKNPELIISMGERGRQFAEENYCVHRINKRIIESLSL